MGNHNIYLFCDKCHKQQIKSRNLFVRFIGLDLFHSAWHLSIGLGVLLFVRFQHASRYGRIMVLKQPCYKKYPTHYHGWGKNCRLSKLINDGQFDLLRAWVVKACCTIMNITYRWEGRVNGIHSGRGAIHFHAFKLRPVIV